MSRIALFGPSITKKEIAYVAEATAHGWNERAYEFQRRFEQAFAEYVGRRHAICTSSCTTAIHLALLGLGVSVGDEVILPDSTWVATVSPVIQIGAIPVLVDIDPDDWCITAAGIADAICERTKAIITVDLYGNMPDYNAISAIATERGVALIEDAAESIGSTYRGRPAGAFGDVAVFSFHGAKIVTTGEGGMVLTDRNDVHQRIAMLAEHGRIRGAKGTIVAEPGYKYKMTAMQAALGLAQLERVEELLQRKQNIFEWYRMRLSHHQELLLNHAQTNHRTSNFWLPTVTWPKILKRTTAEVIDRLRSVGIETRPFFEPLSSLPALTRRPESFRSGKTPVAYDLASRSINLPASLSIVEGDVDRVCSELTRALGLAPRWPGR